MENKQIIIDGVDVSGCAYFAKRRERFLGILQERCKCEMYYNEDCLCEIRTDCYYKQYIRKEQECERLKKIIDEAKNSKLDLKSFLVGEAIQNEYEQQLNQLKAEIEVLEKVNKVNQEKIKKLNEQLEEEFIAKQYGDEALFFTLIDIKELAEKSMREGRMISGGWLCQKISEVIDV